MSTNGINTAEEAGMTECDGEKVVTMMDVLQEQEEFEEDANAVLGASDDKNCTYSKGYIKRQAIYACLTCCGEAKDDPSKRAGVCLACSLTCHENHDLVELYTKRNFRCDCGNPKFNSHPCQFTPDKTELNEENKYNQNFSGLYCICQRPYPDPESTFEDEMIQCIICEDWLHSSHLDATVPTNEQYAEMICKGCMEKNEFIHDYSDFAVNNESNNVDIMAVDGAEVAANTTSEANGTLEKTLVNGDTKSSETNNESETKEEMDVDTAAKESESKDKESDSDKMLESTANENAMDTDKTEEIVTANVKESENSEDNTNQTEATKESNELLDNKSENNMSNDTVTETNENANQPENNSSIKQCDGEKEPTNETSKMEVIEGEPGKEEISSNIPNDDISKDTNESKSEEPLEKANSDPTEESVAENKENADDSQENKEKDADDNQENKEKDADDSQENQEKDAESNQAAIANNENNDGSNQNESVDIESHEKSPTEGVAASAQKENEVEPAQKENEVEPAQKETDEESGPVESEIKSTDSAIESEPTKPAEDLPSESEAKSVPNETEAKSVSVENEVAQTNNDHPSKENNEESENIELASNVQENKRKLSTEQSDIDESITKKAKLDVSIQCVRPKEVKKRFKGATFWPHNFRQKLCTCNECISMYKDLSVLFLIDPEDTVTAYETLGKEKINGAPASQYEKGLLALSSLDRVHQINALTEYNKMRDKLLDFLKSFKDRKEVVKEEDIKAFFAEMKPKREPDGVYFCR